LHGLSLFYETTKKEEKKTKQTKNETKQNKNKSKKQIIKSTWKCQYTLQMIEKKENAQEFPFHLINQREIAGNCK